MDDGGVAYDNVMRSKDSVANQIFANASPECNGIAKMQSNLDANFSNARITYTRTGIRPWIHSLPHNTHSHDDPIDHHQHHAFMFAFVTTKTYRTALTMQFTIIRITSLVALTTQNTFYTD